MEELSGKLAKKQVASDQVKQEKLRKLKEKREMLKQQRREEGN